MSSSLFLKKRPDYDFGPWHDHYVSAWSDCHPDYEPIYLRKYGGVKVCKRTVDRTAPTPISSGPAPTRVEGPVIRRNQQNIYHPGRGETRLHNNLSRPERVIPQEVRKYVKECKVKTFEGTGISTFFS